MKIILRIQRFNPDKDDKPWLQEYELADLKPGTMLLDALLLIKAMDPIRYVAAERQFWGATRI